MFRPERNTSPFSLLDMDMWDTNLTAQTSAWCGMATVSGSGFLSKVNTSSSGSTGSFRQNDSGLRKWQSLSHLAPNVPKRSFSTSPQSELRSGRGHNGFRQTDMMQWLQEAEERLDTHMDLLKTTDSRLKSANMLDMKPRERQMADTELYKLKQALREAESRAKRQEEERKQTLQKLQTSAEAQRALLSQKTELNQRLTQTLQKHSELQEQLSEANNKISQGCLEKAMLSTQVLKLEEKLKELMMKLSAALSDKDHLAQEKADLQEKAHLLELQLEKKKNQSPEGCELDSELVYTEREAQEKASIKEEITALRQVNEQLTNELDVVKQTLKKSQAQVQELTTENTMRSHQLTDLEAECAQLVRDKQELLNEMNATEQEELDELKGQLNQLRESSKSLNYENQRKQDHCVFLEAEIFEKEQQLKLQEDKYRKIDAGRVQQIEELKAVTSHWTEKWQKAALTLQSAQAELEELQKKNKNMSLQKLQLDAYKQELELEKSRSQKLLKNYKEEDGEAVETQSKETQTDAGLLSQTGSPLSLEGRVDSQSSQDITPQLVKTGYDQDVEVQTDAQLIESLKVQLEESKRTAIQLQQEKTLALQQLQTQLYSGKDENGCAADRKNKVSDDIEQQRRMVTEQLKNLFMEREGNEMVMTDDRSAQDWTQTSRGVRSALDRRSWHQGSGLMPVYEEDETKEEELDAAEKMSAVRVEPSNHKANNTSVPRDPALLRTKHPTEGLHIFAEKESDSDVNDLPKMKRLFCPDGIFHVEMIDICSPDEDEVEQQEI